MLSYPVWFPPVSYRGSDAKRRTKANESNRLIAKVSKYVNEVGIEQTAPFHRYMYFEIAKAIDEDEVDVRRLCNVDGGGSGFIVLRPGLTSEQAFDEASTAK